MSVDAKDDAFLTVAEVAELLKLNQQTVRNWIEAGTLPALRIGRRVRIRQSAFDRFVEQSANGSADPHPAAVGPSAADFWGGALVGDPVVPGEV